MNPSLSIVLPIRSSNSALAEQVGRVLEVVPELTTHFEVLLVDDDSNEPAADAAHDLARIYPQVRVVRHDSQAGAEHAAETGVARARGEIVLVHEGAQPLPAAEVRRLWALRDQEDLVTARSSGEAGLIQRLIAWGKSVQPARSPAPAPVGVQMIRRRALNRLSGGRALVGA